MNAKKKLPALLLVAGMIFSSIATITLLPTFAEEGGVSVEESFDDYSPDYDVAQTLLSSVFTTEANSIGDGYIRVEENPKTGNLHLMSHVFTQVYNTVPMTGRYTFSLDVFQTQGAYNCAFFLRAPKVGDSAYYETDGSADGQACCQSGAILYFHSNTLDVNIKAYEPKAVETGHISANIFSFTLPDGVSFKFGEEYTNVRVEDDTREMKIFVEDQLVCRLVMSDPNKGGYSRANVADPCFKKVVLLDAAGTEVGTVENPLMQAEGATVGWATRVANMIVDNVYLSFEEAATSETEAPTAPETEAPTAPETEAPTTPETEAPTTPETEAPTTPVAGEDTNAPETDATTVGHTEVVSHVEKPADKGCSGALGMSVASVLTAAAAAVALRKKQ